jgi:tetratricopeptide (TPR) repeat protein
MTWVNARAARWAITGAAVLGLAGCAATPRARPASGPVSRVATGPAFPDLSPPDLPARMSIAPELLSQHEAAWQRLQAGDLRGADRAYSAVLKQMPGFYPAETGLGLVALAERQLKSAVTRFRAALERDPRYAPALRGLLIAEIGLDNFDAASATLDRLLAVDPQSEADRTRLDVLRVRHVQRLTEAGRRAREARRYSEAEEAYARALTLSPSSAMILRELGLVELATGRIGEAEARIRRALQLDASDADSHAALGAVLEARGRVHEAATSYARAAALDSAWRAKADAVRAAADSSGLPDEIRDLEAAKTVSRGHLAAIIGIRLNALLTRAPKRAPPVATDIRTHWAAAWIVATAQAGVMDVFANHTFQPASTITRSQLAQVVSRLLTLAYSGRPAELAKWQSAKPKLADIPATNVFYRSAALAVATGAMRTDASGRFEPTRPVSGAEVLAAMERLEQLGR